MNNMGTPQSKINTALMSRFNNSYPDTVIKKLNSKQGSAQIYDRRNTPLHLVSAEESKTPSLMQGFARNPKTYSPIQSIHRADSGSDL